MLVCDALNAFSTSLRRNAFSSSFDLLGSPRGCGIATAGTIRLAPTVLEMGTMLQMCTVGIPALSISFAIVAPQRVQVPQVELMMTASTPSRVRSLAISRANFMAFATDVPFPTVA